MEPAITAVPAITESRAGSSPFGRHTSNGKAASTETWMKRWPVSAEVRYSASSTRAENSALASGVVALPLATASAPGEVTVPTTAPGCSAR